MKILTEEECEEWLRHKVTSVENVPLTPRSELTYLTPPDSGHKTLTARILAESAEIGQEGLFRITGWGIFPSAENMALFDAYRSSLGESRRLWEAPGHILNPQESKLLECLLDFPFYFIWDAVLFDEAREIVLKISNDEYFSVYARDQRQLNAFERAFADLKRLES